METQPLQLGDIVRLKSGGLKMTVTQVDGNEVKCLGYDADSQKPRFLELEGLHPACLVKVEFISATN